MFVYFSTFPASAAAFPKLITIACFVLPGIAALIKGLRSGDAKAFNSENLSNMLKKWGAIIKTSTFKGTCVLLCATLLYSVLTAIIGFFPTSVIYFLIVLFGIYRMPIKGTLIYTACSIAFLYVFFAVIFNVKI